MSKIIGHAWISGRTFIGVVIIHDEITNKSKARIAALNGLSGFNELADMEHVKDYGMHIVLKAGVVLIISEGEFHLPADQLPDDVKDIILTLKTP